MSDEKYIITGEEGYKIPEGMCFSKCVIAGLKRGGDGIAQIDAITGKTTTYRDILQKSINLAVSLRKLGLRKSDVVSICSENRFEYTVTSYAVFYIGGVVAPISGTYTPNEIMRVMELTKPRFIFCSPSTVERVKEATVSLKYVEKLLLYGTDAIGEAILFDHLVKHNEDIKKFQHTQVNPVTDHLAILSSSGTTGLPKGVMLTHQNFLVCTYGAELSFKMFLGIYKVNNLFAVVPWYHAYGFLLSNMFPAIQQTFIYANRFEEKLYLSILEKYKITTAYTVPTLVVFLAKHPLVSQYDLSSLREIRCGTAPLPRETEDAIMTRFKHLKCVRQGYGLTEMTLGVLGSDGMRAGSVGKVISHVQAKVQDLETGQALGPYKEGELCFKGPLMMKGYVGDVASTASTIDDKGWLHTGDVGYYDDDKYFFVVDRIKELIKYKGNQVAPAEIEAILLQHPDVVDAGVVGIPDEVAGELPVAFIVRKDKSTVSKEELIKLVTDKVSPVKRLRGGVIYIKEIPRNGMGKILRRELKKLVKSKNISKL